VIAFADGGALDTVIPGQTGELFSPQSPEALAAVLERFDAAAYDPRASRANAERFGVPRFERELRAFIDGTT
jgi:glycosyltransferase involved in cell wall biosynthesis